MRVVAERESLPSIRRGGHPRRIPMARESLWGRCSAAQFHPILRMGWRKEPLDFLLGALPRGRSPKPDLPLPAPSTPTASLHGSPRQSTRGRTVAGAADLPHCAETVQRTAAVSGEAAGGAGETPCRARRRWLAAGVKGSGAGSLRPGGEPPRERMGRTARLRRCRSARLDHRGATRARERADGSVVSRQCCATGTSPSTALLRPVRPASPGPAKARWA
jgi:hypothetical protein